MNGGFDAEIDRGQQQSTQPVSPQGSPRLQAIQELGQSNLPPRMEGGIHCLPIIGQVEGHVVLPAKSKTTKYEHVIPQLVAVEQNPAVRGLIVVLNTVGGDIEAGLAIAEMIRSLSKPTVSLILGGGHSIGAPIAVAARRSFIASTATVTVHPIRLSGLVIGVPQTYEYLDKMQDRVIRFIVENSRISEGALRELMFRTGELVRDVGHRLDRPRGGRGGAHRPGGGTGRSPGLLAGGNPEGDWRVSGLFPTPGLAGFCFSRQQPAGAGGRGRCFRLSSQSAAGASPARLRNESYGVIHDHPTGRDLFRRRRARPDRGLYGRDPGPGHPARRRHRAP